MIDYLYKNNILIGLIWEPEYIDEKGRNYQSWLTKTRRTHSQFVYTTDNGGLLKGYSVKGASELEPFAIHVKNEFGDGIFFINDNDESDDIYFVIINDGRIISGSDKVVKRSFFDSLVLGLDVGPLSHLEVKELNIRWIENIVLLSQQRQAVLNRKKKLFVLGVTVVGAVLLVMMAFFLNMMLS